MLELRVPADRKRLASMRAAIQRECERSNTSRAHGEIVALVTEQLVDDGSGPARSGRRSGRAREVLVIVTVQSDATMLMVRDARPDERDLGARRQQLLEQFTARWSTMSGRDGRTIWAEIARSPEPEPAVDSAPVSAPEPAAPVADACEPMPVGSSRALRRPSRLHLV